MTYRSEPPSEPQNPKGYVSTKNSISLSWNPPKMRSQQTAYYEVKYKGYLKNGAKWIPVFTETNATSLVISDLKCDTEYEFKVRAVNFQGDEGPAIKTVQNIN